MLRILNIIECFFFCDRVNTDKKKRNYNKCLAINTYVILHGHYVLEVICLIFSSLVASGIYNDAKQGKVFTYANVVFPTHLTRASFVRRWNLIGDLLRRE